MRRLRHQIAAVFTDRRRCRIGVLGGSFNPAHSGHSHIADMAARHLDLDEIWWLVSPQNPLKSQQNMAEFSERFASALHQASQCIHAKVMRVSAVEKSLNLTQTADVLARLRRHTACAKLIWIMGADNLAEYHRWHKPDAITRSMAVAIINRPGWRSRAINSAGASILGTRLRPRQLAKRGLPPRHWCFIDGALNHQSATDVRAGCDK
jgi:nicotinate-nucleotide adenylyltransferase